MSVADQRVQHMCCTGFRPADLTAWACGYVASLLPGLQFRLKHLSSGAASHAMLRGRMVSGCRLQPCRSTACRGRWVLTMTDKDVKILLAGERPKRRLHNPKSEAGDGSSGHYCLPPFSTAGWNRSKGDQSKQRSDTRSTVDSQTAAGSDLWHALPAETCD